MKQLLFFVVLACLSMRCEGRCAADSLAEAQQHLLAGRYAEAQELLEPLAADDAKAAIALARTLESQGKSSEAVQALAAWKKNAAVQAELARLAFARGDHNAARTCCAAAIHDQPNQLLARWILAELDRTSGKLKEAERGYTYLIHRYNGADIEDPESLCWIALAAARNARWNRLSDQFDFLVNELYLDAAKMSGGYWPADYGAGLLLMEKYNAPDAAKRFHAALEKNPNAAEVHAAMAELALTGHQFDDAARSAAAALKINPQLLSAWLVEADLKWANFRPDQALEILQEHALKIDPTDEETLGRVAACYALLDGTAQESPTSRLADLEAKVLKQNPKPVEFYFTLGAMLADRNRHDEAARYLDAAVAAQPRWIGPDAELGQLAMRTGREDDARKFLKEAFDADPFNVRVHNMLEVLDVLKEMKHIDGAQCVLCYSPQHDQLLARYAAASAESEYPRFCRQFGYTPPRKPLVEIFNESKGLGGREWFATRMTGLPYVGVAAATTGCTVGMVSPHDARSPLRYNWARALRHELVHVVTLQQTDFNIPHWLTEGLAVKNEGGPPPQSWNRLLLARVKADKLYDLDTLNFGFTRPASGDDWQLAYCQAELYVAFMIDRFGQESPRKLLTAYSSGADTPRAIQEVFGTPTAEFERKYRGYLQEKTRAMTSLAPLREADAGKAIAKYRRHPEDADAAAEAAFAFVSRGADGDARKAADQALQLKPNHPLATYVAVRLKLKAAPEHADDNGQPTPSPEAIAEAIAALEPCLDRQSPQPHVLGLLAKLKQEAEKFDEAEGLYLLGEKLDNVNLAWTRSLARLYLVTENTDRLAETLERLAQADADDLPARRKLTELALEKKDFAQAARWAREAIDIEVGSSEIHRQYAQALAGLGQYAKAADEYETALGIDPEEPFLRFALADALVQTKDNEKARRVLEELIQQMPDYPGAEVLLESLKENKKP